MPQLSAQAKAIGGAIVAFLLQLQVYVGQGGIEALTAVTLGQWIAVVVGTLGSYGIVYSVPNAVRLREARPSMPVVTKSGAPFVVTLPANSAGPYTPAAEPED